MIIFRYLTKEVITTALAVTLVLLMIIMSGRFINYLADAANGELAASVLFPLIAYRIPGFLELILPLGLFLGILLGYGRLYLDQEITVLTACGYSNNRLQLCGLGAAGVIAMLAALLSFWVTPWATGKVDYLLDNQNQIGEFETLTAGRFQESDQGHRVTYVGGFNDTRTLLNEVFVSAQPRSKGEHSNVIVAESGVQYTDPNSGDRFIVLRNGYRYVGDPGKADYLKVKFDEYGFRLREAEPVVQVSKVETLPTSVLMQSDDPVHQAYFQWRLSVPIVCLVVSVLAVALSRVNPRQGRFARILPAIILYQSYIFLLSHVRTQIEEGVWNNVAAFWLVHAFFLLLALAAHFGWLGYLNPLNYITLPKPAAKSEVKGQA